MTAAELTARLTEEIERLRGLLAEALPLIPHKPRDREGHCAAWCEACRIRRESGKEIPMIDLNS